MLTASVALRLAEARRGLYKSCRSGAKKYQHFLNILFQATLTNEYPSYLNTITMLSIFASLAVLAFTAFTGVHAETHTVTFTNK
jgi:hypothetical protein